MPEATPQPPDAKPSRSVVNYVEITPDTAVWTNVSSKHSQLAIGDDVWALYIDVPDIEAASRLVEAATMLLRQLDQQAMAAAMSDMAAAAEAPRRLAAVRS